MTEDVPKTPAGWYPDGDQLRYWDGSAWTEHTAPRQPQQAVAPPPWDKKAEKDARRNATARAKAEAEAIKTQHRQAAVHAKVEADAIKAQQRAQDNATKREADEVSKALKHEQENAAKTGKRGDELRPDIVAAMGKMSFKMGSKREIKRLPEHLWEDEQVHLLTGGTYGSGTGVLVLTNRRLLFLKDGVMNKTSEDFPLEKISSIQWSTGMLLGKMTVFASGNKAEILNVQKQDGKVITDAVRSRIASGPASASAPAAPATPSVEDPDVYEHLKKLGELHQAGVLTDEEFASKKQRLLDKI
jgi:hypothetical protein